MDDRVKKALNGSFANLRYRQEQKDRQQAAQVQAAAVADNDNTFIALLALEGEATSDGRYLTPGALQTRSLPIPLTWQYQSSDGHDGSIPVGKIEEIWRVQLEDGVQEVWGRGVYDVSKEAQEAKRLAANEMQRGISIDAIASEWHTELVDGDPENVLQVMDRSELMGATQVTHPAFRDAFIALDAESSGLVAAGGVAHYASSSWFKNPNLKKKTPLQVTPEGQVFGHIAAWDTCHIAFKDVCMTPPASETDYAYFNKHELTTSDGKVVRTGVLTDGTNHLMNGSWAAAQRYYDHTGYARADVVAGEDDFGIWVAGALRPDLDDADILRMTVSDWSGDWREISTGNLELVGVLAVNCAGYPIARQSNGLKSLVAAGALHHEEQPEDELPPVNELVARVEKLEAAERKRRLENVMSKIEVRDKSQNV